MFGVECAMPLNRDKDLREAGARISDSGLTDDIVRTNGRNPSDRASRRREAQARDEPEDLNEDDREDADDDAADSDSNPYDEGESDDADGDDGENENSSDDDDDTGDESQDGDDDDRANSSEKLYAVKVDGKTVKLPVRELVAGYQRQADYQTKTQALAERRRGLDKAHSDMAEFYKNRVQVTAGVVGRVYQLLIGDINGADMQRLRAEDPQEWAYQRQVMQERADKVKGVLAQVQQELERHVKDHGESLKRQAAQAIPTEMEAVARFIGDWAGEGRNRLGKYLLGAGFTEDELAGTYDHRMLIVAEKARRWDVLQSAKAKAGKKKRQVQPPKTAPSKGGSIGRKAGPKQQSRTAYNSDRAKLRKSGDMRDAGRAITHLLK